MGERLSSGLSDPGLLVRAEAEMKYIRENGISCCSPGERSYPYLLSLCEDAPLVLFRRGSLDFGPEPHVRKAGPVIKYLSIVGTRRPSPYGLDLCRKLVRDLADRYPSLVIVSGLAYGIDKCAHQSALESGLRTIAVLGHGFSYLYPAQHRQLAGRIERQGALITDFTSREKPERNNFIKRNRIIAGISEATVVVESGPRGGALVTAEMAGSYYREVLAFPGRVSDPASRGCNQLVRTHRAALMEDYRDIEYLLGWEPETSAGSENGLPGNASRGATGANPPVELGPSEIEILGILETGDRVDVDHIHARTGIPMNLLPGILLKLELMGLAEAMPGNQYRRVRL